MADVWIKFYWYESGKGYQIKMEADATLNYSASGGARYGDVCERPVHFETSNTENNMIIGLPLNAWESTPSIGDEIYYGEMVN